MAGGGNLQWELGSNQLLVISPCQSQPALTLIGKVFVWIRAVFDKKNTAISSSSLEDFGN